MRRDDPNLPYLQSIAAALGEHHAGNFSDAIETTT